MSASGLGRESALAAIDGIIASGGDADDVLREVLAVLGRLYPYVALGFVENGALVAGPSLGDPGETPLERFPISYDDVLVGELATVSADDDRAFLENVSALVAAHVLLGWDTGGESWDA